MGGVALSGVLARAVFGRLPAQYESGLTCTEWSGYTRPQDFRPSRLVPESQVRQRTAADREYHPTRHDLSATQVG